MHLLYLKKFMIAARTASIIVLSGYAFSAHAEENRLDPAILFEQGVMHYEKSEYREARHQFEKLVEIEPAVSRYYHWLGKCYGRLAENSGWLDAIPLSQKTLKSLEKAVELDDENVPALKDLMAYYEQAPGFLGGSNIKARAIARRLQELQHIDGQGNVTDLSGTAY